VDHSVILEMMAKTHLLSLSGVGFLLFIHMFQETTSMSAYCGFEIDWNRSSDVFSCPGLSLLLHTHAYTLSSEPVGRRIYVTP
jgi:hypothetical protein